MSNTKQPSKNSNLLSILLNIILPYLILTYLSKEEYLGTTWALVLACSFPIIFGVYSFIEEKKVNFISVLGLISVGLNGMIGILALDKSWVAVKEAAVPFIIGVVVLISIKTPFPLVKKMLINDVILKLDKIEETVKLKGTEDQFKKTISIGSILFACSFFVSAFLNYFLAVWIVVSPSGTEAFNEELADMQALSFPVIVAPSLVITFLVLWYFIAGIKKATGLDITDILRIEDEPKATEKESKE